MRPAARLREDAGEVVPAGTDVNVGLLVAHAAPDAEPLRRFAIRAAEDARAELERGTGLRWRIHPEEPQRLSGDDARRPADFLDEASLRMAEGPYDVVVVVTDVAVVSRREQVVPGLASAVGRVVVLSSRRLRSSPRGEPLRPLEGEAVRWNAAALLLHLLGHVLGARHAPDPGDAMAPWRFDAERRAVPPFGGAGRRRLRRLASRLPERELVGGGALRTLAFHLASAARNPRETLLPLLRNRAPLLPLSLPTLATAAVAPSFVLVFSAEMWDVGLNIDPRVNWLFAAAAVVGAALYLLGVQHLFFPRGERRVVTEHMAVVNVAVTLTLLLAAAGLFVMVGLLMLAVEVWIFPPGLVSAWPTLEDPVVDLADKVRLAGFISTVGVLTGALAGGFESRAVVRHLALFMDEP